MAVGRRPPSSGADAPWNDEDESFHASGRARVGVGLPPQSPRADAPSTIVDDRNSKRTRAASAPQAATTDDLEWWTKEWGVDGPAVAVAVTGRCDPQDRQSTEVQDHVDPRSGANRGGGESSRVRAQRKHRLRCWGSQFGPGCILDGSPDRLYAWIVSYSLPEDRTWRRGDREGTDVSRTRPHGVLSDGHMRRQSPLAKVRGSRPSGLIGLAETTTPQCTVLPLS